MWAGKIQWKRVKNKGRERRLRTRPLRTSNESHVKTLIYLWLRNTTKWGGGVCVWKAGKRSLTVSVWNPRKCRREIPHHLQFFGCCRSIKSIPGFARTPFMLQVKAFLWSVKGSCSRAIKIVDYRALPAKAQGECREPKPEICHAKSPLTTPSARESRVVRKISASENEGNFSVNWSRESWAFTRCEWKNEKRKNDNNKDFS